MPPIAAPHMVALMMMATKTATARVRPPAGATPMTYSWQAMVAIA